MKVGMFNDYNIKTVLDLKTTTRPACKCLVPVLTEPDIVAVRHCNMQKLIEVIN